MGDIIQKTALPSALRPSSLPHKVLKPGIDLPAGFIADIKSISNNLFFVFHPYRINYDDLVNCYYGSLEDPRNPIGEKYGQETWGWIMTDNTGKPIPDNTWHIWNLAHDYGWTHVANVPNTNNDTLNIIVNRLGKEKLFKAEFGSLAWNHKMRKEEEERAARLQDAQDNKFQDIQRENKGLTRKAMENLERGFTQPTNPTKDVITSYSNQSNKSRIVRPITEREAGLVTGEE